MLDEPHVFASTVAENVRLARPEATDAEVEAALRSARLGDWLDALPDGLDTRLGDGAAAVSGGERTRLGLARAVLADTPVLVLDEPTAHLDGATARRGRRGRAGPGSPDGPVDHPRPRGARRRRRGPRPGRRPGRQRRPPEPEPGDRMTTNHTKPVPVRLLRPQDAWVDLSTTAARVMTMAQHEDVDAALVLARRALLVAESDPDHVDPVDLAGLWYAIAVAEHVRADTGAQIEAAEHCLAAATAAGSLGWEANALSIRAVAHVRRGAIEAALLDLARSEVALDDCADAGQQNWAHTGLGMAYSLLRLYELSRPHFERALELDASPLPIAHSKVVDLLNLAECHLRWADELERAVPYDGSDDDVELHRSVGHAYAVRAEAEARVASPDALLASTRALELASRPRSEAASSVAELRAELDSSHHLTHLGDRATLGAALARALWRSGQRDEAMQEAARAAEIGDAASDWQVAASVRWLQVEMQAEAGIPGAEAGREYARLLCRVLWEQRLSTLQGANAALDLERLRHTALAAERAAHEDPLTGVGNRRALDLALGELTVRHAAPDLGPRTSLLVVDVDRFKAVNDTHGHVIGDAVLRAVADALRSVARTEDVVARLGGDEFVVLAHGTDEVSGRRLADRVGRAIGEVEVPTPSGPLRLAASVGVATTGQHVDADGLLSAADAAMYGAKERSRRRPLEDSDLHRA